MNKMYIKTHNVSGFEAALHGMRNPMNSWERGDSTYFSENVMVLGYNDAKLTRSLIDAGCEHRKFLRMIMVWADFNMPRYWWSEFDTYHYNTKNSCSTMHKLLNNKEPITNDLFLTDESGTVEKILAPTIAALNEMRIEFLESTDHVRKNELLVMAKRILPEGFLQLRTVCTNYEELRSMYKQREHHRLTEEWCDTFCSWVETLPYADHFIIK